MLITAHLLIYTVYRNEITTRERYFTFVFLKLYLREDPRISLCNGTPLPYFPRAYRRFQSSYTPDCINLNSTYAALLMNIYVTARHSIAYVLSWCYVTFTHDTNMLEKQLPSSMETLDKHSLRACKPNHEELV